MGFTANRLTVEEIFKDFSARRDAVLRALTIDINEVFSLCDPDDEELCLYGHPTGMWEVRFPAEEIPPDLPEPVLGINFVRDGRSRRDWLYFVAVHSDSWLLSVAFFLGAQINRNDRNRLFDLINELPTVLEVVMEKLLKDNPGVDGGSKSMENSEISSDSQTESNGWLTEESCVGDKHEHGETFCDCCGGNFNAGEIWIRCDICKRRFHGKCANIRPSMAVDVKHCQCLECYIKKSMV